MREKMKNQAKYMHKYKNKKYNINCIFTHTIFFQILPIFKKIGLQLIPTLLFFTLKWKMLSPLFLPISFLAIPSFQETGGENTLSLTKPYPFCTPVKTRWWKLAYVWGTNNFNMETFSWQKHLQHSHFELYKLSNISKKSITCWVS